MDITEEKIDVCVNSFQRIIEQIRFFKEENSHLRRNYKIMKRALKKIKYDSVDKEITYIAGIVLRQIESSEEKYRDNKANEQD
jgi:tRNA C32,U32 (ribose-2'-O)-methylase TrmJ